MKKNFLKNGKEYAYTLSDFQRISDSTVYVAQRLASIPFEEYINSRKRNSTEEYSPFLFVRRSFSTAVVVPSKVNFCFNFFARTELKNEEASNAVEFIRGEGKEYFIELLRFFGEQSNQSISENSKSFLETVLRAASLEYLPIDDLFKKKLHHAMLECMSSIPVSGMLSGALFDASSIGDDFVFQPYWLQIDWENADNPILPPVKRWKVNYCNNGKIEWMDFDKNQAHQQQGPGINNKKVRDIFLDYLSPAFADLHDFNFGKFYKSAPNQISGVLAFPVCEIFRRERNDSTTSYHFDGLFLGWMYSFYTNLDPGKKRSLDIAPQETIDWLENAIYRVHERVPDLLCADLGELLNRDSEPVSNQEPYESTANFLKTNLRKVEGWNCLSVTSTETVETNFYEYEEENNQVNILLDGDPITSEILDSEKTAPLIIGRLTKLDGTGVPKDKLHKNAYFDQLVRRLRQHYKNVYHHFRAQEKGETFQLQEFAHQHHGTIRGINFVLGKKKLFKDLPESIKVYLRLLEATVSTYRSDNDLPSKYEPYDGEDRSIAQQIDYLCIASAWVGLERCRDYSGELEEVVNSIYEMYSGNDYKIKEFCKKYISFSKDRLTNCEKWRRVVCGVGFSVLFIQCLRQAIYHTVVYNAELSSDPETHLSLTIDIGCSTDEELKVEFWNPGKFSTDIPKDVEELRKLGEVCALDTYGPKFAKNPEGYKTGIESRM